MNTDKLLEQVQQINKLAIFKYRDGKLSFFKKLAYKFFGWYADSIGEALWESNQKLTIILDELVSCVDGLEKQNAELNKRITELTYNDNDCEEIVNQLSELTTRVNDIEKREAWTRERFDGQDRRFESGEQFQDWARERFDGQDRRFESGEQFQDWARERFDGQDRRFESGEQFQDWARERFDGQDRRFESGEQFQDWARERCDGLEGRIQDIEHREEWTRKSFESVNKRLDNSIADCSLQSFSQSGEDAIIDYVLRFLKTRISDVRYLDLGANHAKELSNSYKFYCSGASGVLVEANPELIGELKKERPRDIVLNNVITFNDEKNAEFYVLTGDGLSSVSLEAAEQACKANPNISIKAKYTVPTISVNDIIKDYFADGKLDILSIDLEGLEADILSNLDFSLLRPKTIIVESIEYHPYLVCEKTANKRVHDILTKNGYKEYAFTGINSIYLDMNYVNSVNAEIKKEVGIGD